MMKLVYFSFSFLFLLIFTTSCSYFKRSSDTKVIYTVKSNSLNVRQKPNTSSKIIGKVYKGDTIIPGRGINLEWIAFSHNGKYGFVSSRYLTGHRIPNMARVSNMHLGEVETIIRDYLNDYVNWRTGRFWLIMLVLILMSFGLNKIGKKIEDYYYYNFDIDEIGYNNLPYFAALIGGLFSLAYMYSREGVLQTMFVTKFWWLPEGESWLHWYMWSVSLLGVLGFLYFWIKDLVHYGVRGILVIFYYTLTAFITFNAGLFAGIIAVIFAGIWIASSIAEGFSFGGDGGSTRPVVPSRPKKMSEAERMEIFYRQKARDEVDERRRKQAEIDSL